MLSKLNIISPEVLVTRRPPINLQSEDETLFSHEYKKLLPPVRLWNFKNINVSEKGIIFKGLNIYPQSFVYNEKSKEYGYRYLLFNYLKCKKYSLPKDEKYILAFDEWSNGYFHWICDVLPRLESIRYLHQDHILLLPINFKSAFIKESLNIFRFKSVYTLPSRSYTHVNNLIMPGHIAHTGNYNPALLQKVKINISTLFKDETFHLWDKIYVSRSKASIRKIINEDEVIKVVNSYGFKTIWFEDYSFAQQFGIAKNTKYLIAQHGSALTNLLFMNSGSSVLELKNQGDRHNHCYFSLSSELKINYFYQFNTTQSHNSKVVYDNNADIIVDLNVLERNIKKMIESTI